MEPCRVLADYPSNRMRPCRQWLLTTEGAGEPLIAVGVSSLSSLPVRPRNDGDGNITKSVNPRIKAGWPQVVAYLGPPSRFSTVFYSQNSGCPGRPLIPPAQRLTWLAIPSKSVEDYRGGCEGRTRTCRHLSTPLHTSYAARRRLSTACSSQASYESGARQNSLQASFRRTKIISLVFGPAILQFPVVTP
jgi:hypothetical protein